MTGDNVQAVVDAAAIYMRISALFYIPLGLIFVFRNVLQGAGYGFLPMMGGVVELVCRTVLHSLQHITTATRVSVLPMSVHG